MTQLTMTRPASAATRSLVAPLCGMAVYLLASAASQPFDAGDWQFALIASGVLVVIAATVAYAALRHDDPRAISIAALSLGVLALVSTPFVFWLGLPEVFGATAASLALAGRASASRWTAVSVSAAVAGLTALCFSAAGLWIW